MTNSAPEPTDVHPQAVLITGGTSGIGLATARLLLQRGAHVIITGRDEARLERAAGQLDTWSDGGKRLLTIRADVADLSDLDRTTSLIKERHGHLNGVFANAGLGLFQHTADVTEKDFDRSIDVNFKGVFFTVQKALPLLEAAGGGSIVLNASWTLHRGMATLPVYAATKAAVHNLARTLASDLAGRGIRVNSISPGYIVTEMFLEFTPDPVEHEAIRHLVPLKRLGQGEDIAETVDFLLSPRSSYITAQDIAVDGGLVNALPAA
jgi:NAD(P)-dependent dehydrogenase (short-subunit alcohol dehydrogenase family)